LAVLIRLFIFIINFYVVWRLVKYFLLQFRTEPNSFSSSSPPHPDPYKVLGITSKSSSAEIKEAYHQKLKEYHPDKVSHLGADLQRLAQEKTGKIIDAYNSIKK
jgi:preprotein translocase subunit Sec63